MKRAPAITWKSLRPCVRLLARLTLTCVFVIAGVLKLAGMEQTQAAVEGYRLLPGWAVWPAALFLPWAEIVSGAALWVPWLREASRFFLATLLWLFLVAILAAWARGLDIRCGCFGGEGEAGYPWLVARDFGLLGLLSLTKRGVEK
ncbi:MAG: hypothetical protein LBD14_02840 [Puniceicoccales bacterium]|jgi:uncharacterized membrane protein YphA (DoxX/SURF4 family)|nr:hypothetical protein [Puniceicoccales bacterium]